MPLYKWKCKPCEHEWETLLLTKEETAETASIVCPACASNNKEKLIGGTSFYLKGGGWYKDGYGPSGRGKRRKQD